MDYRARMKVALIASFFIHLAVVGTAMFYPERPIGIGLGGSGQEPIVIDLARAEAPKNFVDTLTPSDEPPDPSTDLVSDNNAKAADMSDVDGSRLAPYFDKPSDYDDLGGVAPAPQPVASKPAQPEQPPQKAPDKKTPENAKTGPAKPSDQTPPETVTPVETQQTDTQFEMAKADAGTVTGAGAEAPPELPTHEGEAKGRVDGGVKSDGFMSFEAMQDDFAPYFKDVRDRVERRWRRALQMKYSGASKTKAVVDCAIQPDGKLAYVRIVEGGSTATYALLCKGAIEEAGPFAPFPFNVPEIYRNKNLEIRWTFSFM